MKILHVTAAYKPAYVYGGPTMSVAALCERLIAAGIGIKVYATTANGTQELDVEAGKSVSIDGVPVTYFKRITKDHTHFSPQLLKTVWHKVKDFDAVHIHAWWNLVSVLSCAIATMRGVPVVLSPRGTLSGYSFGNRNSTPKKLIHRMLGLSLLNRIHIHATSSRERRAMQTLAKPLSTSVIANFVELARSKPAEQVERNDVYKLLFLSRIEQKKGLDILLRALDRINVPFHLTVAGDGDSTYVSELKALAESNNTGKHITWTGFVSDDKFALLAEHDLLVLPSHDENFGNVVIESLSQGTAVLVSQHVGLADYVSDQDIGWICDITPASVAEGINNSFADHKKHDRIRNVAPALVQHDFTGLPLTEKYINLYKNVIKNG